MFVSSELGKVCSETLNYLNTEESHYLNVTCSATAPIYTTQSMTVLIQFI